MNIMQIVSTGRCDLGAGRVKEAERVGNASRWNRGFKRGQCAGRGEKVDVKEFEEEFSTGGELEGDGVGCFRPIFDIPRSFPTL